jgi:hypothetical protein
MLEGGTEFDLQVLDKFEEEKRSEGDEAARKEAKPAKSDDPLEVKVAFILG